MSKITLGNLDYVSLSEAELNNLKQYENKMNMSRNGDKEIYLLAFEKEPQ